MKRPRYPPRKYNIYWDASIPMEYYEREFIEYEEYLTLTGHMHLIKNLFADTEKESEYVLKKYKKYQQYEKKERRIEWRRYLKQQEKMKQKVGERVKEKSNTKNSRRKKVNASLEIRN